MRLVENMKSGRKKNRYFPMTLKVNIFHKVNMRQRVNSCTVEQTSLQESFEFSDYENSISNLLQSGNSIDSS